MKRRTLLAATGGGLAAPLVMQHAALGADPITVVGIHDASGGLDIYGKPMVATLEFAVEEINAAGGLLGRPIRLINYDPQSNIQLYTQFATQAATRDRAAVVHGGITSASREAIRPVLRRFNTLYFYNTQYEGGVCDRNCFATGSTPAQNVLRLVPHMMQKWGKKIYILPPTTITARSPANGWRNTRGRAAARSPRWTSSRWTSRISARPSRRSRRRGRTSSCPCWWAAPMSPSTGNGQRPA
jgi:ABC-type branched-subunit amino acid transport system substrate-binding protein